MKSRLGQALRQHAAATSWTMIFARYALMCAVSLGIGAILNHELRVIPYFNVLAFCALAFTAWYCGPGPALFSVPGLLIAGQIRDLGTIAGHQLDGEKLGSAVVMEVILVTVGLSGLLRRASQQLARRQAEQLREQIAARISFWPRWRTSCAILWLRSAPASICCSWPPRESPIPRS